MYFFRLYEKTLILWLVLYILPYEHIFVDVFHLNLFCIFFSAPVICYLIVFLVFCHIPVLGSNWRHDVVAGFFSQILDLPLAHLGVWIF